MNRLTRREATQRILSAAGALGAALFVAADEQNPVTTGNTNRFLAPFDDAMTRFMQEQRVPGAALALTHKSRLVYARGFGYADVEQQRPVEPNALFRIASISKPITSVAVLQLAQKTKFKLDDPVFEVLPAADWLPEKPDPRLKAITIRHLLQHRGGWDRDRSFDPILRPVEMAKALHKQLPIGPADVVRYTLTLPLQFDPGAQYAYSNVGYLLLGRVIEHASGESYEAYIKKNVLAPAGVTRAQLGRAWVDDLAPGEVHYYHSGNRVETAVNGSKLGAKVPVVYGGENFEAFEAHGGWIASAVDLAHFGAAFDRPQTCRLLHQHSIQTMFERPPGAAGHEADGKPKERYYGCGWDVLPVRAQLTTFHAGIMDGTNTMLVRRNDGINWAILFNTDRNADGKILTGLVESSLHEAANSIKRWPTESIRV